MPYPASYDLWDILAEIGWKLAVWLSALWVVAVLGFQALHWLWDGTWLELPISLAFNYFDVDLKIVNEPQSWHGAAAIARWLLDLPIAIVPPFFVLSLAANAYAGIRGESP